MRYKMQTDLPTTGKHHDLIEIYNTVNWQYFNNQMRARITWGPKLRITKRHHEFISFGWCYTEDRLIFIHRTLDRSWVPRFFVEYIVFHEMLHLKYPPHKKGSPNRFHYEQFQSAENKFHNLAKTARWEKII